MPIVSAQRIAMQNENLLAVDIEHRFCRQQRHSALLGETLTDQEITVTVHEIAGNAALM